MLQRRAPLAHPLEQIVGFLLFDLAQYDVCFTGILKLM